MRSTFSAASLLALVSAVAAQTAGFDAITTPAKDESVAACSTYNINWQYTSDYPGTVSIQLLEGATSTTLQLGAVLASGVDNSAGTFAWAVDCSLGDQATYGIKITYDGDSTGNTFQYSNPFKIAKSSSTGSTTGTDSGSNTNVDTNQNNAQSNPESTLYSTAYVTVTSCAATVTNCPASSTVTSTSLYPVTTGSGSGGGSPNPGPSGPSASAATTAYYPKGNATTSATAFGTVTMSRTTGAGSTTTPTTVVTAGAGRVAAGSVAVAAGLVAAVFAL